MVVATQLMTLTCATPRCSQILHKRREGWRGDPIWQQCKRCGHVNRIDSNGVQIVRNEGEND